MQEEEVEKEEEEEEEFTTSFKFGWIELAAKIKLFFGQPLPQSQFVEQMLGQLRHEIEISASHIGTWYAFADKVDLGNQPGGRESFGVRFIVSNDPCEENRSLEFGPLFDKPRRVVRDFSVPMPHPTNDFELIFNFMSIVSPSQNLMLFKEFAMNEIKRLRGNFLDQLKRPV
jgi:hypothetical protein